MERLLDLAPGDEEATDYLRDCYEKRRDWRKLLLLLEGGLDRVEDPAERLGRCLELAHLATDRMRDPVAAVDLWRRVLELDPGNVEALRQLAALLERTKDWEGLAGILEDMLGAQAAGEPDRAAMLDRLIVVCERLRDLARMRAAVERVKELGDPARTRRALERLRMAGRQAGDGDAERWAQAELAQLA